MSISSRQRARDSENRKKTVKTCDNLEKSANSGSSKVLGDLTNSQMKKSVPKTKKITEKVIDDVKTTAMTTRRTSKKTDPACGLTVELRKRPSKSAENEDPSGSNVTKQPTKSPARKSKPSPVIKKKTSQETSKLVHEKQIKSTQTAVQEVGHDESPSAKKTNRKSNPIKREVLPRPSAIVTRKSSLKIMENQSMLDSSLKKLSVISKHANNEEKLSSNKATRKASPSKKKASVKSSVATRKSVRSRGNKIPPIEPSTKEKSKAGTPPNKEVLKRMTRTPSKASSKNPKEMEDLDTSVKTPKSGKLNTSITSTTKGRTPAKKAHLTNTEDLDKSVKTLLSSKLDTSKCSTTKSKTPAKSPSHKSKTPVKRKLPIWKQAEEHQRETQNDCDDVYDFIPDSNEPKKPKRKRAQRKPKGESNYKPSRKVKAVKSQHDLRVPPLKLEPPVSYQTRVQPQPSQTPRDLMEPELPLLHDDPLGAEPVQEPLPHEVAEVMFCPEIVRERSVEKSQAPQENIPAISIISDWDADDPPVENSVPEMTEASCSMARVVTHSSSASTSASFENSQTRAVTEPVSAGTFLSPRPEAVTKVSRRSTLALENCFGFDTSLQENSVVSSSYVESTPLKPNLHEKHLKKPELTGVSPVKKVWRKPRAPLKEKPAPARLENVIQVVPRTANVTQKKSKDRQTTLLDFIQVTESSKDIGVLVEDDENKAPPTPPSAFCQPARRSYSKGCLRAVKRQMFQDYEEEEESGKEEEEECETRKQPKTKKKATYGKSDSRKKTKQETEMDRWAQVMSSHFEDIENFHLSFD